MVRWANSTKGRPTGGLAIRAARLAKVPIEHVLDGRFPKPGTCPMCGHRTKQQRGD